jgi:hypothetical protein
LHSTQSIKARKKRSAENPKGTAVDDVVELTQNLEVSYGPKANQKIHRDNDIVHFESSVVSSFNGTNNCAPQNESNCSPLRPPSRKSVEEEAKNEEVKHEEGEEEKEREELPKFETLKPFAFGSRINEPVVLEGLTLSPYAFFAEIAQPELLNFQILSPRGKFSF